MLEKLSKKIYAEKTTMSRCSDRDDGLAEVKQFIYFHWKSYRETRLSASSWPDRGTDFVKTNQGLHLDNSSCFFRIGIDDRNQFC